LTASISGLPPVTRSRESQRQTRRRHHRDAGPSSRAGCDPRAASGLGRVPRKTTHGDHQRRPVARRCREAHGPSPASRQPATDDGSQSLRLRVHPQRRTGADLESRIAELSGAVADAFARSRASVWRSRLRLVLRSGSAEAASPTLVDEGRLQSRRSLVAWLGSVSRLLRAPL